MTEHFEWQRLEKNEEFSDEIEREEYYNNVIYPYIAEQEFRWGEQRQANAD